MDRKRFRKGDHILWCNKEYVVLRYTEGNPLGRYSIAEPPIIGDSYIEMVKEQPVLSVARDKIDCESTLLEKAETAAEANES